MKDHLDDNNPVYLYKAAEAIDLPDYVLNSPTMTASDVADLSDTNFADPLNRLFPIHTKEACLMSALSFYGQGYVDTAISGKLKKFAASHGIDTLVDKAEALFFPTIKSAGVKEASYALAIESDGDIRRFYPIDNEVELTESARFLTKDASEQRIPVSFLRDAARNMVKKSIALGLDTSLTLPQEVIALGEDRIVDFDLAKRAVETRGEYCGVDELGMKIYRDTIESAKAAYTNSEDLQDFIDVIQLVDEGNRIKYSALIKDPFQIFFSGPPRDEVVKFANDVVFIGETAVPSEVVSSLTNDAIEGNFRHQTAGAIKQARDLSTSDTAGATQAIADIGLDNERALLHLLLAVAA